MSWYQLMDKHQTHTVDNFIRYREVYRTDPSDPGYKNLTDRADKEHLALVESGPQMAAFFGLFYSLVNFLDKLYYAGSDDEYAIPTAIMDENVNHVHEVLKWRWIEHSVMFNDYAKAAALDDELEMFKIQVNLLDSCTPLATAIGQIFYRFDRLVRGRNVYAFIGNLPVPSQ